MIGALWILVVTVVVGVILYLFELRWRRRHKGDTQAPGAGSEAEGTVEPGTAEVASETEPQECCGQHLVCEKESLSPLTDEIIYYDDEELDRFRGRTPESYTDEETEEFRDVLMTLIPSDVAGWARSLTLRQLQLPLEVRDELLLLVREHRTSRP